VGKQRGQTTNDPNSLFQQITGSLPLNGYCRHADVREKIGNLKV